MNRFAYFAVGVLLLLACGFFVAGCGDGKAKPVLSPASALRVSDVPVPKGFSFQAKQSQDSMDGRVRRVVHVYKGGAGLTQVAEFYRTQLPSYGWRLAETFDRGIYRFNGSKDSENCVVSVWRSWWTTRVMIQVFPRSVKK